MLKSNLFKLKNNDLSPAPGRLLIAEPLLSEHHFQRSVILMIECQNGGGMGIVQNKLSNLTLNEIIPDLTKIEDIPIFVGGPLNKDRLFYLHTLGDIIPGAIEVGNNLYIDGDFDVLLTYIRNGNPIRGRIKFFLGYSGWEDDQLINEINEDTWLVVENNHEAFLSLNGDSAWKNIIQLQEKRFHKWLIFPKEPYLN